MSPNSIGVYETNSNLEKTLKTNYESFNTLYTYHTYNSLLSDMENLELLYPNIFELYTAQDEYSLPDVTSGSETYKTWIMRITNENTGFNKPEVLFIGGHHGDETVGIEVAYYYAEWLVENYDNDPFIKYLVDNREIYIMPVVNPYGWEHNQRYDEHGLDMNRDYPYDENSGSGYPFGTIGARSVHELSKDHLFINTASWHGGIEMIIYAWGCYAHNINTESPDDIAFYNQGEYMSEYGGSYSGYYSWGRANDDLYPCYGAYEDYAYAASWDTVNQNPAWPTEGCRSLTHCVEISSIKNPPESTLGGNADIYTPGGVQDGYVPKNIRIALLLTDIAEPYINIKSEIPTIISAGQPLDITWEVMGAFETSETNIQYGSNPNPEIIYDWSTTVQSGDTGWRDKIFSQEIIMPANPGIYYFTIRAKVDQDTLSQDNPEPNIGPQSLWVNMRTNDSWTISNNGNTLDGKTNWYSETFQIAVGEDNAPPVTNLNVNGVMGDNGWHIGDVKVILDASDDLSGVNYTMLSLNGHDWRIYTGEFGVGEGSHGIEFYSVDYSGNVEEIKTGSFKVDYSKPYSTCDLSGSEGETGWYSGNVTVSFDANDDHSGIQMIYYRIDDDSTWHIYTIPIDVSEDGSHIVHYYAVDNAGNDEDENTCEFNIDNVDPVINLNYPVGGETLEGDIDVLWGASDDTSDPMIAISISNNDGSTWNDVASDLENNGIYGWDTTTISDGEYILRATAVDIAGNTISDISNSFMVSNGIEPPEINVDILRPETGSIYLFNNKILSLPGSFILVIGSVDIEIEAFVEGDVSDIDHVELFIDDELKENFTMEPYSWTWDEIGFGKHTIRAVAYDTYDNQAFEEITVWKIL